MTSGHSGFLLWCKQDTQPLVSTRGKSGSLTRTNGKTDRLSVGIEDQNVVLVDCKEFGEHRI